MNTKYLDMYKILPRINYHDYKQHKFYIYCYLDPFDKRITKFNIANQVYNFGYTPIYIGKASNSGFRQNQHIPEYLKAGSEEIGPQKIHNEIKKKRFAEIDQNMKSHNNYDLPKNWDEYKANWVILIDAYQTHDELVQAEKEFIRGIGTIRKGSGPLVNALLG